MGRTNKVQQFHLFVVVVVVVVRRCEYRIVMPLAAQRKSDRYSYTFTDVFISFLHRRGRMECIREDKCIYHIIDTEYVVLNLFRRHHHISPWSFWEYLIGYTNVMSKGMFVQKLLIILVGTIDKGNRLMWYIRDMYFGGILITIF